MRLAATVALIELLLASAVHAAQPGARKILNAAAHAMGRFGGAGNLEAIGKIEAEGRTGGHDEVIRPRDGAFATRDRYPQFTDAEGYDGRTHWREDRSGATHLLNAPFTIRSTVTEAWVKRRGYLQPGSAQLEHVAHEKIADGSVAVLTMRPPGGNPVRLAFDDATHLLVQAQWDKPISTVIETYRDYRPVGAFKAAFHTDIEENGDRAEISIDRYARPRPSSAAFARPRPPADTMISGPATLPLQALSFAVVPARINGHDYDFILDTGGHDIVTPAVAAALGLTGEGKGSSGGSGESRVATSDTRVGELRLGSATMTDQHFTILDLDGAVKRKGKPDMAGILGLEIFERMAVTIDEPNNRLTIEPFQSGRRCEGDKIPLVFDDDQPAVAGKIDGIPAQIGIDVGNGGLPIVLWRWAEAHKVANHYSKGIKGEGHGVGGSNVTFKTPHHDIMVGRTLLRDVDVNYAVSKAGYFSSRADSMNLGRALLQKYAVRFDYAQGTMCVMPAKS
jgi:Aspartyl protease